MRTVGAETPQTPRKDPLRAIEAACEGDNKLTISPVSRMPVKIHPDVCCSPTPCDKENMPPAWENSCVMELNPLSETTPCKADTSAGSAGAEDDSDLAILWVGDSPHAQSPFQPAGEDEDKEVEPDSLRRLLGPPKVRNTFLHYHSPLKTVKVMTPPNSVPPHFAPRTRLLGSPPAPRILSPGPSSPVPPNGVLRLFDFLPDLPPEGHCNVPQAPGQNSTVGNWSYQGASADFSMPDYLGLPWDASMYSQDFPSSSNVLQSMPGMEGLQSQSNDISAMGGTGSQSMMSWEGKWAGPSVIGTPLSGTTTYQQCQYGGQPTQTGLQSTTPSYSGMQQLSQQSSLPQAPHGLTMPSTTSQAAPVPQQLQQVQAQLQQLQLQLQQQAQMTQPTAIQQMQQQIQQLQAQVQMCQDRATTAPAAAEFPATNTSPQVTVQQPKLTIDAADGLFDPLIQLSMHLGYPEVTPFSAPLEPPYQQWSQLSVADPPASHADQSIPPATLPLQQQLEQVVAGRVNMAPGHFSEVSESASGAAGRTEGSFQSAATPARTSSSPSPSGSDARADPLGRAEGERAIRKMGRMGRRR